MPNYKYQYLYGETWKKVVRVRIEQDKDRDRMVDIVIDAAGPEFKWDVEDDSKASSVDFYCMLKDADEPL